MANDSKTLELQIRVATQEALKAVSALKGEMQSLAGEAKRFESSGGGALKNSFKDTEKFSGSLTSSFTRQIKESLSAKNAFGQLASSIASAVSVYALAAKAVQAFTGFVTSSVAAFAEYETIETNLTVVMGSAEKASAAFEELKVMAARTPFGVAGLAEAAIQLKQTGTSMRDMTQVLSMLGDAAGGSAEKFSRLVANYAQIQSVGKTTAMDIKQFALMGLPIYETLRDLGVQGTATADQITEAFQRITAEGGSFFNGMSMSAETLSGKISTLKDNWTSFKVEFAESSGLSGIAKWYAEGIGGILGNASDWLGKKNSIREANRAFEEGTASAAQKIVYAEAALKRLSYLYDELYTRVKEFQEKGWEPPEHIRGQWAIVVREKIRLEEMRDSAGLELETATRAEAEQDEIAEIEEAGKNAREELDRLNADIEEKAAKWKATWAEVWKQFQAGQSKDPFAGIELEREKKKTDAYNNYIRDANKETIDQIDTYYDAQRSEVIKRLADEEARTQRELSETKIDDLEYELQTALEALETLEAQRVIAAGESEAGIAAIRERFAGMREETEIQFEIKIEKTAFEEAKSAVEDFGITLADNLSLALMDTQKFSDEAAIILGNLSAQFIELASSSALSGFEEFGRALGEGKNAAESLEQALAAMARQILRQLPMMFLQAGLQLIANGQWPLGLGFIAAAGTSALLSGYADGASGAAQENARGGVYDEYGKAARAFAAGGTFTSQIVSGPTCFRHGGGLGLMGEAGPEAIMPLKRMSNGDLGVEAGTGGGTQVIVNIINNSGAEVRKEEKTDSDGNKQLDIVIGSLVNNHIASGKADRVIGSRYGLRAAGV